MPAGRVACVLLGFSPPVAVSSCRGVPLQSTTESASTESDGNLFLGLDVAITASGQRLWGRWTGVLAGFLIELHDTQAVCEGP